MSHPAAQWPWVLDGASFQTPSAQRKEEEGNEEEVRRGQFFSLRNSLRLQEGLHG